MESHATRLIRLPSYVLPISPSFSSCLAFFYYLSPRSVLCSCIIFFLCSTLYLPPAQFVTYSFSCCPLALGAQASRHPKLRFPGHVAKFG